MLLPRLKGRRGLFYVKKTILSNSMPKQKRGQLKKKKKTTKARPRRKARPVSMVRSQPAKEYKRVPRSLSIPTAYAATYPKTYATIEPYRDAKYGVKGASLIKYGGAIVVASSTSGGGGHWGRYNNLYSTSNISSGPAGLEVNPNFLIPYGSLAQAALGYSRFMYRRLKFTWIGLINTNTNGGFAMQYTPDGAATTADFTDYSGYAQNQCHMFIQGWNSQSFDVTMFLNTKDMYYVDWDEGATDAGLRQSYQGICTLIPNPTVLAQIGSYDWGVLYVEAELVVAEQTLFAQNYAALPPKKRIFGRDQIGEPPVLIHRPLMRAELEPRSESKSGRK